MGETISEKLKKAADVLHWLGKYDESYALMRLAVAICQVGDGKSLDEFNIKVETLKINVETEKK